jgi:hypothetical protein
LLNRADLLHGYHKAGALRGFFPWLRLTPDENAASFIGWIENWVVVEDNLTCSQSMCGQDAQFTLAGFQPLLWTRLQIDKTKLILLEMLPDERLEIILPYHLKGPKLA